MFRCINVNVQATYKSVWGIACVRGLGDKGKLTDNMIDRLRHYYGIATSRIQENLVDMKNQFLLLYFAVHHKKKNQLALPLPYKI